MIDMDTFFTLYNSTHNTRGHCYKLETERSRRELRRNFFSQRVVSSHWNALPEYVVKAESVNAFNNKFNKSTNALLFSWAERNTEYS